MYFTFTSLPRRRQSLSEANKLVGAMAPVWKPGCDDPQPRDLMAYIRVSAQRHWHAADISRRRLAAASLVRDLPWLGKIDWPINQWNRAFLQSIVLFSPAPALHSFYATLLEEWRPRSVVVGLEHTFGPWAPLPDAASVA